MNRHLIKYLPLAFLICSCSTIKLPPPSPDKQSILILPVEAVNTAQFNSHGFYYIYTIKRLDRTAAPYEAVFKLPIKENMLLVNSLPPGRYAVKEFKFLPIGGGEHTYGKNVEKRNDQFVLEPEKITLFQKSLNILSFNRTVGRGAETSYSFDMEPVSASQKEQILSVLKAMPSFELWELQNDLPTVSSDAQGDWIVDMKPETEASVNGKVCQLGPVYWTIEGEDLTGDAMFADSLEYRIVGQIENTGTIEGIYFRNNTYKGAFAGKYYSGELIGTYRDPDNCKGSWKATRTTAVPDVVAKAQGKWDVLLTPITESVDDELTCRQEAGDWEIEGENLVGKGKFGRISGQIRKTGAITGSYYRSGDTRNDNRLEGEFTGKYSNETLSGTYRDSNNCEGTWETTKRDPYLKSNRESVTARDLNVINVAGTYSSQTTGYLHRFSKTKSPVVKLIQNGKAVTGTFGETGKVWGEVFGNTIKFDWYVSSADGRGAWTFDTESGEVSGSWFSTYLGSGDWNLTKIE